MTPVTTTYAWPRGEESRTTRDYEVGETQPGTFHLDCATVGNYCQVAEGTIDDEGCVAEGFLYQLFEDPNYQNEVGWFPEDPNTWSPTDVVFSVAFFLHEVQSPMGMGKHTQARNTDPSYSNVAVFSLTPGVTHEFSLYDMSGRRVGAKHTFSASGEVSLSVSDFPGHEHISTGVYFIKASSQPSAAARRIVHVK